MSFGEVSEVAWVWTRSFLDFCETVFTLYGERKADLPPSQQIQSEQIAQTEVLEMGAGNGDDMIRFDGQASLVALRGTLSLELGEVFGSGISYAHCAHCIVPFKPCTLLPLVEVKRMLSEEMASQARARATAAPCIALPGPARGLQSALDSS